MEGCGEESPFCLLCQFKQKTSPCRPAADAQCDLPEFCNGSSASCPPDLHVQDGHGCERGTGYCYKGRCRSPDLQCRQLYGTGNAAPAPSSGAGLGQEAAAEHGGCPPSLLRGTGETGACREYALWEGQGGPQDGCPTLGERGREWATRRG